VPVLWLVLWPIIIFCLRPRTVARARHGDSACKLRYLCPWDVTNSRHRPVITHVVVASLITKEGRQDCKKDDVCADIHNHTCIISSINKYKQLSLESVSTIRACTKNVNLNPIRSGYPPRSPPPLALSVRPRPTTDSQHL
jgi:hypothetical protein